MKSCPDSIKTRNLSIGLHRKTETHFNNYGIIMRRLRICYESLNNNKNAALTV